MALAVTYTTLPLFSSVASTWGIPAYWEEVEAGIDLLFEEIALMVLTLGLTLFSLVLFLTSCVLEKPVLESFSSKQEVHNPQLAPIALGSAFQPLGGETGIFNLPRRVRHIPTGIVLILIEPGTFTMGTPISEAHRDGDEEEHQVTIASPYYLGETEVTVAQWAFVMGTGSAQLPLNGELPLSGVSWYRAREFVNRLNQSGDGGWRLPTEAEWEYACRAGTTTAFSFGDDITPEQVNYNGQRPYSRKEKGLDRNSPVPVRSLPPNPWGLYEMHGNLWEWCDDLYLFHPHRDQPPKITKGASRVMRGGAFTSRGKQARSGYRDGYPPNSSGEKYGFRLTRTIPLMTRLPDVP